MPSPSPPPAAAGRILRVLTIPCLVDNYAYLLVHGPSGQAVAIDPVSPERVATALTTHALHLTHILTTHHHLDHCGGNVGLKERFPGVRVLAGDRRSRGVDALWEEEEVVGGAGATLWLGDAPPRIAVQAHRTPGHTTDSLSFHAAVERVPGRPAGTATATEEQGAEPGVLFTGDTLFAGGCGRLFEGTPAMMYDSLVHKLARAFPPETLVYCGHEYTRKNLAFGLTIEPDNAALQAKVQRLASHPPSCTMPSSLGEEIETNVFLRAGHIATWLPGADGDAVRCFGLLREAKDRF